MKKPFSFLRKTHRNPPPSAMNTPAPGTSHFELNEGGGPPPAAYPSSEGLELKMKE